MSISSEKAVDPHIACSMCSSALHTCCCPVRVIRESLDHLDRKGPREVTATRATEVHVEKKGHRGSRLLLFS